MLEIYSEKKIVVTGGAGFIGSAVVARLNQAGCNNIIIVDSLRDTSKWQNLVGLRYEDFLHKETFFQLLADDQLPFEIGSIVHMGACSATTEKNADYLMENNFHYSKELAQYALSHDIRFIYASSAATYGLGEAGYEDNTDSLRTLRPLNMYGYSKHLLDLWANENELLDEMVGLKFFNVFGPNEYHKADMRSVVHKSFEQIQATGKVKLFKSDKPEYKDGEQKRDFIYVKDVADVIYWFLENPKKNGLFNLGFGKARSWNDLVNAVYAALGRKSDIEYIEMPDQLKGQYQYFTEAPMNKLKTIGYTKPFTSLEDSVADYVKNYLLNANRWLYLLG